MLVLAIETSGDLASVTLARENALVAELIFRHKMDLLRRLTPNIDRLLADTGVDKKFLDGIVVSVGPGSFTGLRIGAATAKAISYGLKRPLVGIRTLDVLAHGAPCLSGLIVPMIHARPGEVYAALFQKDAGGLIERLTDDTSQPIDDLLAEVRGRTARTVVLCGDGAERNRSAIEVQLAEASIPPQWFNYPRGHVLAALGIERLARGDTDDAVSLVPHYVRRSTPEIRAEQQGV